MTTQNPSSSSSSSSSSASKWIYDVFVSFRGEDTRKTFTDHLYTALSQKGIHTFKDDEKLERGKEISPALLRAIEESRFSIIVLSNNYASSTWCLDELVKILECKETTGQTVLPIFYNVEPSEVRKQTGSFAKAFAKYEEEDFEGKIEKVQRWRAALKEVANLSGWDLRNIADGVWMHDLLREMGQEIVRQESPKDLGKRSRLWLQDDVYRVLKKNTGVEAVEGISLKFWQAKMVDVSNEAFTGMENLRLLKFSNVHPLEDFNYLPNGLRCIIWDGYPLKSMPSRFDPKSLVQLYMPYSRIEYFSETKIFENLEFLNLSHSQYLLKTPNFSRMPKLKILTLEGCTKLVEVHPSNSALNKLVLLNLKDCKSLRSLWKSSKLKSLENLILSGCSKLDKCPEDLGNMKHLLKVYLDGTAIKELPLSIEHLTRLVLLDLGNCKNLASLPSSICKLKSLETLTLSGCSNLDKLPENLGNMQNLVALFLDGTAIRQPPSSIVHLRNLRELSLCGCKGSTSNSLKSMFSSWFFPRKVPCSSSLILPSLSSLRSLRRLDLSDCNLSSGAILGADIVNISSLEELNLSKNNFVGLPATFSQLNCLKFLWLEDCARLQALPPLPSSIYRIEAHGCRSLETLPYPSLENLRAPEFVLSNCKKIDGNIPLQHMSKFTDYEILVPGSEIPKWMNHQSMGSSISFEVPPLQYTNFKGIAFCAVFTLKKAPVHRSTITCSFRGVISDAFFSRASSSISFPGNRHIESDHVWLRYESGDKLRTRSSDGWHHIEASFEIFVRRSEEAKERGLQVKKCGVHLIYEEHDVPKMIHYNSSLEEEEGGGGAEEDIITEHTRKRLVEEEASGSPHPKRMRGNTNTVLKLKDK